MGRRPRRAARVPTIARHGRLKRYSAVRAVLKFLAAAVAVLLVSGGSVAAIATWSVVSSIQPSVTLANETPGVQMPDIDAIEGGVNLLLVGSDSRQGQDAMFGDPEKETATLNDVTMLLHISEDHSSATVVSFPRDLFVPIPACPNPDGGTYGAMSSQKINTTLSYGGLPCTVLTVEKLTGLSIPFAAEVQFNGVIELSNAVGGVDVCVGSPIKDPYTGLDLAAGTHNLQGLEALQFLRTRHGVGDGSDLGRISNQQVFLSALVRTLKDGNTLSDPTKLFGIAKAAASNMTLSNHLNNLNNMVSIALALKDIPFDQIVFVQYPNGIGESGGQSGVLPIKSSANALFQAIQNDQPISLTGGTGVGSELDPNAPGATETPAPVETSAPVETPTTPPLDADATTPPATPGGPVALPENVLGQTAEDRTCSKGNN
jgi:LCP family protein required for cell wall assembly